MKDIEVVVENLTNAVFDNISNLEEGIESLAALHNYTKRKTLVSLFEAKTLEVRTVLFFLLPIIINNLTHVGDHEFFLYFRCIRCSVRKY